MDNAEISFQKTLADSGAGHCFSRKIETTEEHWSKVDQAAIRHKKASEAI